jgi:hypothetical protein
MSLMSSLKKEDFSPLRRKDRKDFLWTSSVLSVLAVLFSVDSPMDTDVFYPRKSVSSVDSVFSLARIVV